jgi:hypothetical protein
MSHDSRAGLAGFFPAPRRSRQLCRWPFPRQVTAYCLGSRQRIKKKKTSATCHLADPTSFRLPNGRVRSWDDGAASSRNASCSWWPSARCVLSIESWTKSDRKDGAGSGLNLDPSPPTHSVQAHAHAPTHKYTNTHTHIHIQRTHVAYTVPILETVDYRGPILDTEDYSVPRLGTWTPHSGRGGATRSRNGVVGVSARPSRPVDENGSGLRSAGATSQQDTDGPHPPP